MKQVVLESLAKPFKLKERKGLAGKIFKYVASEDIVDRMNTVFKGNWNAEVIESKMIEDQLLMLVRVHVFDEERDSGYFQDGYASYPVFRFTSGDNKGKLIDIGNSYRSAMSKAIKTACSRWGVALFLEEAEGTQSEEIPSIDVPFDTVTETAVSNIPQAIPSVAPPATPVTASSISDIPFAPPVDDNIPPNTNLPIETPNKPVVTPNRTTEEPVFTDNNIVVPDPESVFIPSNATASSRVPPSVKTVGATVVETLPPVTEEVYGPTEVAETGGPVVAETLTPVQKVAIESLMSINNIKFNAFFTKAIPGQEAPSSLDGVSYLDAVKLIQCGNHLKSGSSS